MSVIDHSVYPDVDHPPDELIDEGDRADYVHRICAAWDYGVHPTPETFDLFRTWRDVFDRYPFSTSPAYHAFRAWFGWPAVPLPRGVVAPMLGWEKLDQLEGRPLDPCADQV